MDEPELRAIERRLDELRQADPDQVRHLARDARTLVGEVRRLTADARRAEDMLRRFVE